MHFILSFDQDADSVEASRFDYYVLFGRFTAVFSQLGGVSIVCDPKTEVDPIFDRYRAVGEPCVFVCFAALDRVPLGLRCPTVPVFAWSASDIRSEMSSLSRAAIAQFSRVIALSTHAARALQAATSEGSRVSVIFPPVTQNLAPSNAGQGLPSRAAEVELYVRGLVVDSMTAGFSPDYLISSLRPEPSQQSEIRERRLRVAAQKLLVWSSDAAQNVARSIGFARSRILTEHPDVRLRLGGVIYTAVWEPIDDNKNWHDLISGFCWAFRDTQDATLVLKIASGGYAMFRDSLIHTISRMAPFQCRIIMIPSPLGDEAYERLIGATTYYVNASKFEALCLPMMEFMASGKPAISPDHTAMEDYVSADTGFVLRYSRQLQARRSPSRPHRRGKRLQSEVSSLDSVSYRLDWESLLAAYRESYKMAKSDPECYFAMGRAAATSIRSRASQESTLDRLKQFFATPSDLGSTEHGSPGKIESAPTDNGVENLQTEPSMTGERPDVGIRDAHLSGWFRGESGEVFEGLVIRADDVVLDVGCGDGGVAQFCAGQGAQIILADIDAEKVSQAEHKLSKSTARTVRGLVTDSNPLPLPDGSASVVISTEVLEHVDEPVAFLRELVRVGRPDARYLLSIPDPVCEILQKSLAPPDYFKKPNHVRIVGRSQFAAMVESAGLAVERRASYGFYSSLWWLLFWVTKIERLDAPHPLLDSWSQTWSALLDTSEGIHVKTVLDEFMPKSQVIIARKRQTGNHLDARENPQLQMSGSTANLARAQVATSGQNPAYVIRNPHNHAMLGLRDAVLSGWFKTETNEVFEGLPVTPLDVVLDVGCGDGGIANFCAGRGAAIILADSDQEKVSAAERKLAGSSARSVRTVVSESNPLPIPDGEASIVISTEVLEHVDDPNAFLAELVRVGRPGARYLLTVPDPVCESLQKSLAPPSYFAKPNHIRIVGRDEFADLVERAGLVIERRASYGFYWSLWWLMYWATGCDIQDARHPILDGWTQTWATLLDTPGGLSVKRILDNFMPKSQIIIARKPGE